MIGLMLIAAFLVYLSISTGVVYLTIRWARKTGRGVKKWSAFAVLCMYLLMFWDHIPTFVVYKYYCSQKAGFWVYKTPDKWKSENPGVARTLTWQKNTPSYVAPNVTDGYILNERFVWANKVSKFPCLPLRVHEQSIIDLKNNETVIKRIGVGSGYSQGINQFRFWAKNKYFPNPEFYRYVDEFQKLGEIAGK